MICFQQKLYIMKTMIRVEKSRDFSILNNIGLRDRILSWKTKGLLAYLLKSYLIIQGMVSKVHHQQ